MKKINIVTNYGILYSQKRLILLHHQRFKLTRKMDLNRVLAHIFFKLNLQKYYKKYFYLFNPIGIQADGFHFFNTVTSSKRPWIVTLEADFNRFQTNKFDPLNYIVSTHCKYIFPYSNWAMGNQLRQIQDSKIKAIVSDKMRVLYPPQEVLVKEPKNKVSTPLKFILVGFEFFRKGGYEALKAFERLHNEGYKFEFTIISDLGKRDFPGDTTEKNYKYVLDQIRTKDYINYYNALPNAKVLELLKKHHVGVLLSHLETFGYFVLECQASALPVITTTQRAFLEINANDRGWFVDVPVNDNLSIEYDSEEKRKMVQNLIEENFYEVVKSILTNPSNIINKSKNCLDYIQTNHNLEKYKNTLSDIYEEILFS